jgi:hypothetical protein
MQDKRRDKMNKEKDFTSWFTNSQAKKEEYKEILLAQKWARKKLRREAQKWEIARTINKYKRRVLK